MAKKKPNKYLEGELKSYYNKLGFSCDIRGVKDRFIIPKLTGDIVYFTAKKLIEITLDNPKSAKAEWVRKFSKPILKRYCLNYSTQNAYQYTMAFVVEAVAKDYPDVATKWLASFATNTERSCLLSYVNKIYNICQTKECLDVVHERLQKEYENKEPQSLFEEAVLYKYAVLTKDSDLLKKAMVDRPRELNLDVPTVELLAENMDYEPFLQHLKQSNILKMSVNIDSQTVLPAGKNLLSGYQKLQSLDLIGMKRTVPADALLPNKGLKRLEIWQTDDIEKVLKGLPNLESLEIKNGAQNLYKILMAHKPQKLCYLDSKLSRTEAKSLMQKYPDLAVPFDGSWQDGLYRRNLSIAEAKKNKTFETLQSMMCRNGFVEYLRSIDKEDRPTFKELVQKGGGRYNLLDLMRDHEGDKYLERLDKVYELCDFSANKKEAEMFKAIEHQNLIGYLKSLPEAERMSIEKLTEPLVPGSKTFLEMIKQAYGKGDAEGVVVEWLELSGGGKEQTDCLCAKEGMSEIAEAYDKKQKQKQATAATRSAFEKWKEEHGRV